MEQENIQPQNIAPVRPQNTQVNQNVQNSQDTQPVSNQNIQNTQVTGNGQPVRPMPTAMAELTTQSSQNIQNVMADKTMANQKTRKQREPLNDQSKGILFGMLGGFFLLGGVALLVLMFLF